METGLIFQERKGCHISEDDYSQSLFMALQEQENNVHGQVKLYTRTYCRRDQHLLIIAVNAFSITFKLIYDVLCHE